MKATGFEAETRRIRFDGRTRSMVIVHGDDNGAQRRPIVLVFHGSNQTGERVRRFAGYSFDALAAGGAIVAYPDAVGRRWNAREPTASMRGSAVDDIGFASALVDSLVSEFGGDADHVYAVGYSNGGHLVMRLAHATPERLAGIAVISATQLLAGQRAVDGDPAGLPTLFFHGTKDKMVPYDGGTSSTRARRPWGPALSAWDSAAYFAQRNGISTPPSRTVIEARFPFNGTRVECVEYRQAGTAPVTLYSIVGGGHTIPNPTDAFRFLGATAHDIVAAEVIAESFGLGYQSGAL